MIQYTYDIMLELSKVLGILSKKEEILEEEILDLIEKKELRQEKKKNYKLADEIRDELKERGIILEDTQEGGVKWRRQ